jgi:hypothetical protein
MYSELFTILTSLLFCRPMTKHEFLAAFNSVSARLAEADPTTPAGREQIMQLFNEHGALYNQLNNSNLAFNMQLCNVESRVFAELMSAVLSSMRAAIAAGNRS